MNKYEVTLIFSAKLDEAAYKEEFEKVQGIITRFGGTVEKIDEWGRRRLAYDINKQSEGIYVVLNVDASPELPAELESRLRINENVIRYLIIRVDA